MKNNITQEYIKKLLYYNEKTGIFTNKTRRSQNTRKDDTTGIINKTGYISITLSNIKYQAHRLAFLYMEGYFPEHDIDHINRIKHDNRWKNLRHVSRQCNMRNTPIRKTNTSGVTGVSYKNGKSKWVAQITVNNKNMYLGIHAHFIDAVKARWDAEKEYKFHNCQTTSSSYLYLKEAGIV